MKRLKGVKRTVVKARTCKARTSSMMIHHHFLWIQVNAQTLTNYTTVQPLMLWLYNAQAHVTFMHV